MFSAESSSHVPPPSTTLRNTRRRPRQPSAEGAGTLPRAKRQRSVVADDIFFAPTAAEMGRDRASSGEVPGTHGRRRRGGESMDMVLRERKIGERGVKEDGIVLTKNDNFIVTKLPGFPDYVRNNTTEHLRGLISSVNSYALLLTPTHALVWSYIAPHSSPETFCFTLPTPTSNAVGSLPLGSLVSPSTSSAEPGIVVVMPMTGKVIYWDSISRAAAQDLFRQQKQGVQGSVGSMLTGETVSAVVNAEPAGFILSFSSGRIAHLSVKDGQGRPAITVNFMRSPSASSTGGLFGSLRNALVGSGWRRGTVAARAGRVTGRGEREVAIVTARGQVRLWDVNRAGNYALRGEADAREDIMDAMRKSTVPSDRVDEDDLEVFDFAFAQGTAEGNDNAPHGGVGGTNIIALVNYLSKKSSSYAVVELSIGNGFTTVGRVHTISCYTNPREGLTTPRPRIYLPIPGHTAFVVFTHAIVIVSLIRGLGSPDQQLLLGANSPPNAFQDVIDFRDDVNIEIVGSGEEHGVSADPTGVEDNKSHRRRSKHPACVLLVRGGGVLRVTAFPAKHEISVSGDLEFALKSKILKSRIEQAIFYGSEPRNPLNFTARSGTQYSLADIEEAALEISGEILDSTSKYIPTITPSMDNQLHQRADALVLLALHLKENYPPLSRLTKWKLLWDAEKLAAARAMWKNYDTQLKERKPGEKKSLQSELYFMLGDHLKTTANEEVGELDEVRQWFTRDVSRIEHVAQWLWHTTVNLYEHEGKKSYTDLMPYLAEAQEVSLLIFETALMFRKENAPTYGLESEALTGDGILAEGYKDMPEFWTSTTDGVQVTNRIVELARNTLIKFYKYIDRPDAGPPGEKKWDPQVYKRIVKNYPRHIELCQLTYLERISWLEAYGDGELKEKASEIAEDTKMQHVALRRKQIMSLETLGLIRNAYYLSEKFKDFTTLVSLVIRDVTKTTENLQQLGLDDEEKTVLERKLEAVAQRIDEYYQKFGHHWARALYQNYVQAGRLSALMENGDDERYQTYLTNYLRSDPRLLKLSWINDVLTSKNYGSAGETLIQIADSEDDLWSKKVELSLGKLARSAAIQTTGDKYEPEEAKQAIGHVQDQLGVVSIQEILYRQVAPVLHGAIDRDAEVQLAMDLFAHVRTEMTSLYGRLVTAVTMLVNRQSMPVHYLIDLLTLVELPKEEKGMRSGSGEEFFMALKALKLSGVEGKKKEATERMIWRRAYIREDWDRINNTEFQDDAMVERTTSNTAIFVTLLTGLRKDFRQSPPLANPDGFQIKDPRECLGSGINAHVYDDIKDPEALNPLLAELEHEDAKLKHYLAKARLHMWVQGIMDAAAKAYSDELGRESEREKELYDLENKMKKGFRIGAIEDSRDAEGDMVMIDDDDGQAEEASQGRRIVRWETPALVLKLDKKGGILYHSHKNAKDDSGEGIFEWY